MAEAIVDAVRKNRAEVLVGAEVYGIRLISRLAPSLARRLARVELSP